MRLHELTSIKPIKPKSPEQLRISTLQNTVKQSQERLRRERETQHQKKQQQALVKQHSTAPSSF
jgi:hypothetical protein